MLDLLSIGSTFIPASTPSALPFALDEHALPADRQNPLSAITRRNTSDGTGFTDAHTMYGEKSFSVPLSGDSIFRPISLSVV